MGFKFNGIIVHFPRKEKHRDVIGDEIFRKSREKIYITRLNLSIRTSLYAFFEENKYRWGRGGVSGFNSATELLSGK